MNGADAFCVSPEKRTAEKNLPWQNKSRRRFCCTEKRQYIKLKIYVICLCNTTINNVIEKRTAA